MFVNGELKVRLKNLETKVDINHQLLTLQIKQDLDTTEYLKDLNIYKRLQINSKK
jgi:hypothetical protein